MAADHKRGDALSFVRAAVGNARGKLDPEKHKELLAALEAADRHAAQAGAADEEPRDLKQAAEKAREVFAQSRKDAQSADVSN